ncbi:hypothetical protein DUNSADRAFT_14896 [Dunaliella salina]|uniref:Encoded protein n=1 Tax=Dunaliella salina TaxID=3046 RepID=A0ABQ7G6I6_DUNSA|nr:hypothetical protein DUNSADRAFT_14896 [Dunaliella salina]|eukprot:KAF5830209.1 hypothetical protein DUNSADRAFT_14896 [Dunaliella salina]
MPNCMKQQVVMCFIWSRHPMFQWTSCIQALGVLHGVLVSMMLPLSPLDLDEMFGGGPPKGQKAKDDQKKKGEDPFGFVNEELAPIPPPPPPPPPVPAAPLLRLHETWRAKVMCHKGGKEK